MDFKIIFVTGLIAFSSLGVAQMSKTEKKEWKKKMKGMDLEGFKQLTEEKEEAQESVSLLTSENATLVTEVSLLTSENATLQSDVEDYKLAAKEAAERLSAEKVKQDSLKVNDTYGLYSRNTTSDVIYKVQIGSFKKFDITKYFDNHKNFSGEINDDGTMKYTLGGFPEYWEADKFKKFLREMGVNGAWVVAYKEGKRVNMQDAREGI
jgi:hypothetical protein